MHNTICAIMHLFATYQKEFCQLYPVSVYMVYRGVPRSVHSEFAVCGIPPLQYMQLFQFGMLMAIIHLPLNKTEETNIYRPLNKMDDNCYMVTFQIRTFGRNICNRLTPFMVYFLFLLLQKILLDITPRNINYTSQSSLCKLYILLMSNLQMIVIVYGVSFKCVVNKLISNCGLSHQPDKLYIYIPEI